MNPLPRKPVLVAGIGNPDRGDDGFGPAVAARLARLGLPRLEAVGCLRPLDLLDLWQERELVLLVDAALGEEPGKLHRLEPLRESWPPIPSASTHGLGLAEAIALGRALGSLPARLVVYAAEGSSFLPGAPLSAPLRAAVEETARRIVGECGTG